MPYPRRHNAHVVISSRIASFFYTTTKDGYIGEVLKRLQRRKVLGTIVREDIPAGAVCVQFLQTSKPLWLKRYEVDVV